ncbi:Rieske (2Fe-2S) protein [Fluviispira multicolorata]|uniref:Rieske 2Fe-2S domain-containing protein n=1 Tax=Fluviispira multicolorata TaxID=2654512 RepID=A0A833JDV5_9BACT|nr:Rieske 2Fe-2S domain-containing protein [Fluviispira multicolorata]KAB8032088.1 Rieske 2Fe-2S domain-containing protein [Fluviispira multicolorata]
MAYFKVCSLSLLSTDKPKKFTVDGLDVLLVKALNDNKVWAFDNTCTHADKSLENGLWNSETTEITCPFHKAVFNIAENGAVKKAPACVSLPVYQTEIRNESEDNIVYIFLD